MVKLVGSVLRSFKKLRKHFGQSQRKWTAWDIKEKLICEQMWLYVKGDLLTWRRGPSLSSSLTFLWVRFDCAINPPEAWTTWESKHLLKKCNAWVSLCLIKCVAVMSESLGSWQDLPIVSYLPCETQAALKQGHIFTGYFGLICKSIDARVEQESVLFLVPPLSSEGRLSGFKGFNCHVWGDNTPHPSER